MAPTIRILTVATLVVGALGLPPAQPSVGAVASTGGCGGVVFRDLDADGARTETLDHDGLPDDIEVGVTGVAVTILDVHGDAQTTTTDDGSTRRITETIAAGDLQRACRRSNGWVVEGTPGCPGGFGNGWEFFDGESYGWQSETALGSVARLPGRSEVVATQMNPIPEDHAWSSGGLVWHGTSEGSRRGGIRLYDRQASPPGSTFENASGLGDLAVLCGGPPPSIGGSVWHDADADGLRDPDDGPIVGAAVELIDDAGEVISTDSSDEQGAYSFDESNVPGRLITGARYRLSMGERNHRRGSGVLVGLGDFTGLTPTASDVGDRDDLDSDGVVVDMEIEGQPGAVIEVVAGDDPATPETENPIAHQYDFGLRDRYDLAVVSSPGSAMRNSGVVAFHIEIRNEGSLPSGPIEVEANLPPETSLQAAGVRSMIPTSIGAGSVVWALDEHQSIAPGDVRRIDMQLRVNDPTIQSITNSVAIIRDSGPDEDSDPGLLWDEDDEAELTVDLYGLAGTIWVGVDEDDTATFERDAGGVVVHVLAEDGTRVGGTTTDESGRFLFDSFPSGSYRVAIPASEFSSEGTLRGHDQAVGGSSRNIGRMLDRDGHVTTDVIELGAADGPTSPSVRLGVVRQPPTPLVDVIVPTVLVPIALLFVAALMFDRRRHLGGALRPADRV